ncbi:MAG: hypothetical protein J6Y43_00555 [Clostridia bacterium]|nr:hypothetical protein [Clostridia bacterium]
MKYSSQKLGKILKKTEDELSSLIVREGQSKEFNAAVGEDAESIRPAYNFSETQEKRESLETKVRTIKHALNTFNIATVVPELNMTIDQALIYIPQLLKQKRQYAAMKDKMTKTRVAGNAFKVVSLIDYTYINYDVNEVSAKFDEVSEKLAIAQMALDKINSEENIELDLE